MPPVLTDRNPGKPPARPRGKPKPKRRGGPATNPRARTRQPAQRKGLTRDAMANLRYGFGAPMNPAATWKAATPKQRKRIGRFARKRGRTLVGLLGGGPRALQERSSAGLRREASRTIAAAYAPVEKELNFEEKKERELNVKRQEDEKFYEAWLMGEQAKIRQTSAAADKELYGALAALQGATDVQWDAAQQHAQTAAVPGSVSNVQDYEHSQLTNARAAAEGAQQAGHRNILGAAASGQRAAGAYEQANISYMQGRRSQNDQRFHESMRKIAESREVTQLRRSGDIVKELSRLQTQQIDVANANRDYGALATKLGIQAADVKRKAAEGKAKLKLANKEYLRKLNTDQLKIALDRLKVRLTARDIGRKERADLEKARHNVQGELEARRGHTLGERDSKRDAARGKDKRTETESNRYAHADDIVTRVRNNKGKGAAHNRKALRQQNEPSLLIDMAIDIVYRNGRLTRGTYDRARRANIPIPRHWRPR